MSKLRKFQREVKEAINLAWAQGARIVAPVLSTGAGKTVLMGDIARDHDGHGCAIAHRSELVGQISLAFAREGVRHDIVAPKAVLRTIVGNHMKKVGASYYDPRAKWKVVSVDTLLKRDLPLSWLNQVTLVFIDECFPAGTLIDGRPIESLRHGDVVTAFNEQTGGFERRAVVRTFSNPMPPQMVRLRIGHHVIECTSGHPFWTHRGWVEAGQLETTDEVYKLQCADHDNHRVGPLSLSQDRANLLPEIVRDGTPGTYSPCPQSCGDGNGHMLHVQPTLRGGLLDAKERPSLLRQTMLQKLSSAGVVGDNDSNQPQVRQREDACEQPDARRNHSGQGERNAHSDGGQAQDSGRQWEACNRSGNDAAGTLGGARVCQSSGSENGQATPLAEALQNRLREPYDDDRGGSGRPESWPAGEAGVGREEGPVFAWERVASISLYEPSNPERSFVYNIEVEGLHTYVANGVVVHNCHHVLRENKWGRAFALFPNARGLFPTATPERADGKGLGSHADGLVDELIVGPGMRDLIDQGYLTDYRILAPTPKDFDMRGVDISPTTGDYNAEQMRERVKANNRIIGDVVASYLRHTPGQLGITFAVDVEHATTLAAAYCAAGVPAQVVHAGSTEAERRDAMDKFCKRELLQLVNVDLFGEGVDVPALEVVSFVRPTASYGLFTQQFGRALRLMVTDEQNRLWDTYSVEQRLAILACGPKPRATIIDHVGNVILHRGPPDWRKTPWTLDARNRRTKTTDGIPLRACINETCLQVYERMYPACPYCGMEPPPPAERGAPEHVDGDLTLYTPELLEQLFGALKRVDGPALIPQGVTPIVIAAVRKRHQERQEAQAALRETMLLAMPPCVPERVNNRRFYLEHGIDTLAAQALGSREAGELRERILNKMGVEK